MSEILISENVQKYQDRFVPDRPAEMLTMEAYAKEHRFPIIGPASGHFCYQIARMIGAQRIFEMGSGYGYSTAWFAKAVRDNGGGVVHHVVWDNDLSSRARKHLTNLGYNDLIEYHVNEAIQELKATIGPFDLIFNDIDKEAYPESLPIIQEKLRSGGVLIIDNMLWSGRIFDQRDQDSTTEGIRKFVKRVTHDTDWIANLIPVRDGLVVAYKK